MQSVEIIADSKNEFGQRITTVKATFWRALLAELNTHRVLTRNSASSRAIRFEKMVEAVMKNPFIPMAWQKDHTGMQGTEYFDGPDVTEIGLHWLAARDAAVDAAKRLSDLGVTKQICNRLLEPFMYHTALITFTEIENFVSLRAPQYQTPVSQSIEPFASKKDCIAAHGNPVNLKMMDKFSTLDWLKINKGTAEIHFMDLAEKLFDAMNASEPKQLKAREWHIPFGDQIDSEALYKAAKEYHDGKTSFPTEAEWRIKVATTRCARISYVVPGSETKINYAADLELHDRLAASGHMSAFEHCARAMSEEEYYRNFTHTDLGDGPVCTNGSCKNFRGFIQYRAMFENENRSDPRLLKK